MIDENRTKLRIGIYLRLSDEDRNKLKKDDDSESIKNQRYLLLEEIKRHKNYILVDEYCDEDLSGAGTFRPEFERLIKDCENKKLDIVLCKSQSRFSRDMEIIEKYLHNKFIEWNIRFIGLADNSDTNNTGNKKARQINGLVNEWYLEDISNNIRSAFKAKMQQGEFISPFAAFGYEISKANNNQLVIDPIASLIVQKIFQLYLKGLGFTSIAKYLNNQNIPSPSLYKYQKGVKLNIVSNKPREQIKWSLNSIKKILTNELYCGHLIQGKRTTISYKNHKIRLKAQNEWIKQKNTHEAIISEEIFKKVQKSIKKRTRPIKKTGKAHLFSGKVWCLECGHLMRKKNSSKHEYLVCSSISSCINKNSIRYDLLEELILNTLNKKIDNYYDKKMLCALNKPKEKKELLLLEKQKTRIERKISENEKYLKNLYEDKINNIINNIQFKILVEHYQQAQDMYLSEKQALDNKISKIENKSYNLEQTLFNKQQSFIKLNKVIVDEFIKNIYIGGLNKNIKQRNIRLEWNFLDEDK